MFVSKYLDTVYRVSISGVYRVCNAICWISDSNICIQYVGYSIGYCTQISVCSMRWNIRYLYISVYSMMDTVWNIISRYLYIMCIGISVSDMDIGIDIVYAVCLGYGMKYCVQISVYNMCRYISV